MSQDADDAFLDVHVRYMSSSVRLSFVCTSLLYFVVRVGFRRKTVHVRYLICWWASCS